MLLEHTWEPLLWTSKLACAVEAESVKEGLRVRPGIGHREKTRLGVLDLEILVFKLFAPD